MTDQLFEACAVKGGLPGKGVVIMVGCRVRGFHAPIPRLANGAWGPRTLRVLL